MFQSRNRGSGGGREKSQTRLFLNVVIWKEQVVLFVGDDARYADPVPERRARF